MKQFVAMVLCLALLLAVCAASASEIPQAAETAEPLVEWDDWGNNDGEAAEAAAPEKETLGVLKVDKAFDIRYSPLPDQYSLYITQQNDMTIIANIKSADETLPRMGLVIAFNDEWADTERLNDVSDEDLQAIKDSFSAEYPDLVFGMKETLYGTQLLTVMAPSGLDAYVYTIYKGHEIEIHLIPGAEQEILTDADLERVVAFLSDMDFVPVDEPAGE